MKKVIEYDVVEGYNLSELIAAVEKNIVLHGYQPLGNHIQTNTMPYRYQQTMVKYEKD